MTIPVAVKLLVFIVIMVLLVCKATAELGVGSGIEASKKLTEILLF